jgi:hypothetical protein
VKRFHVLVGAGVILIGRHQVTGQTYTFVISERIFRGTGAEKSAGRLSKITNELPWSPHAKCVWQNKSMRFSE